MAQKRNETFTVIDRRSFTSDGQLRSEVPEEQATPSAPTAPLGASAPPVAEPTGPQGATVAQQKQQADAYRKSSEEMDREVEQSGQSAKDLEITFERFLASLYMTGMVQLGVMSEQGAPPQLDLMGARQTVDSLSLLAEKTKGNLTPVEQNFLQSALYELRMAYVEVTNAIAKGPQQVPSEK